MSATATENPALHDHLVTGETLFVTGAVLAMVSEIALTFRALVIPNWTGIALGSIFIVGTLYLVNWLYTGKKEARTPAAIWAGVQIAIALVGTLLLLNLTYRWDYRFFKLGESLPATIAVPSALLGLFKIAAYSMFLYLVTQKGPALFFLRHRGGEAVEVPSPTTPPEDVHPTGIALPLAADQADKAEGLSNILQYAGIALLVAGGLLAIVGGQQIASSRLGWISLGEGAVLLILGLLTLAPISAVSNIKERGPDTAYITDALAKLGALFNKQVFLTLALIALSIGGIILRLTKG